MRATIRPYTSSDLASILGPWERTGSVPVGDDGLTLDQAVELMASTPAVMLVAGTRWSSWPSRWGRRRDHCGRRARPLTRPSLSAEILDSFKEDVAQYARY